MPGLNGWVWLRFIFKLCWVIYRRRVDLLHVNSYVPGNYAHLAAALMQVPIIIDHWHGFTRFSRREAPPHLPGPGAVYRPESGGFPGS